MGAETSSSSNRLLRSSSSNSSSCCCSLIVVLLLVVVQRQRPGRQGHHYFRPPGQAGSCDYQSEPAPAPRVPTARHHPPATAATRPIALKIRSAPPAVAGAPRVKPPASALAAKNP